MPMADNTIDTLKIVIEGDSEKAVGEVTKLIDAIGKIDETAKNTNGRGLSALSGQLDKIGKALSSLGSNISDKFGSLAESLKQLNGAKISSTVAKGINDIGDAMKNLKDADFSKLNDAANAVAALSQVKYASSAGTPALKATAAPSASSLSGATSSPVQRGSTQSELQGTASGAENATDRIKSLNQQLSLMQSRFNVIKSAADAGGNSLANFAARGDQLRAMIAHQANTVQFLRSALDQAAQAHGATSSQASALASQLNNAQTKLNGLQGALNKNSADMKRFAESAKEAGSRTSKLWSSIKIGASKAASSLKSLAAAPFKKIGDGVQKATGKLGQLFSAFKRIAMYRLLRSAIKAITDAMKEGTNNAYQYSKALGGVFAKNMDSLATSALYLKNSLGAMVMPLINAVTPAINFIIDKFVDLLNVINMVIARLSGASTWTKALKYPTTFGDEAKNASGALKELKATILGIDEINPLNDNSNNGSGSGGSSMDYSKMFEDVPLEDAENTFGKLLDPFKEAWEQKGQGVINSMKTAFENIKTMVGEIGTSFANVWTNGTGTSILSHILGIVTNISNIVGGLAKKFTEAWKANKNGETIIQNILGMFDTLVGTIDTITASTAEWIGGLNLTPLMSSFSSLTGSIGGLFSTLSKHGTDIYNNILLPIAGWFVESGIPAAIETISSALDALKQAIDPVLTGVQNLHKACEPIIQWVEGVVLEVFHEVQGAFSELGEVFKDKGPEIENIFKSLGEIIQQFWAVAEPIFTALKNTVLAVFGFIKNYIIDNIGLVTTYLDGFLQFLSGIFTGDFEKAWEGIKKIFGGFVEYFKKRWDHTKEHFTQTWEKLKQFGTSTWNTMKTNGINIWTNMTTSLTNLWSKAKTKVSEIWDGAKTKLTSITEKIRDGVKKPIEDLKEKISDIFGKIKEKVLDVWEKLKQGLAKPLNGILGFFETMVNGVIRGLNRMITALNKLSFDVPEWIPVIGGKKFGFNLSYLSEVSLPRLAEGGLVTAGTAFIAGENGAEVIAQVGNRTGVMNTDEMRESVELGVMAANAEQNSLIAQGIALLQELASLSRENNERGGVSGADLLSAFGRMNRRAGKTIINAV